MKYLKKYNHNLFESLAPKTPLFKKFYDDLEKLTKKYEEEKDKIRKDYKDSIDDYMLDITDIWGDESLIEDDDPVVWYTLKFKHEDVRKIYDELIIANNRLKKSLGLKMCVEFVDGKEGNQLKTIKFDNDLLFAFHDEFYPGKIKNPLLDESIEFKRIFISIL